MLMMHFIFMMTFWACSLGLMKPNALELYQLESDEVVDGIDVHQELRSQRAHIECGPNSVIAEWENRRIYGAKARRHGYIENFHINGINKTDRLIAFLSQHAISIEHISLIAIECNSYYEIKQASGNDALPDFITMRFVVRGTRMTDELYGRPCTPCALTLKMPFEDDFDKIKIRRTEPFRWIEKLK